MLTLVVVLLTLSILILVHEMGHYLAAKKTGIKVEEFGFGYPPRLWGKKIGETFYSLNWIPFGGFVKLYGEELSEEKKGKNTFWSKSKKARTVVILAGVLGNFLLAVVCFSVFYSSQGIPTKSNQVRIIETAPNSPAAELGLKENDLILAVDDVFLADLPDDQSALKLFVSLVEAKKETPIKLLIQRDKSNQVFYLTPRAEPPEKEGPLGVVVSDLEMKKYPFWQMPFLAAVEGIKEAFAWGKLILVSLGKILIDLFSRGVVPKDVAGPIGIIQVTAGLARQGILVILQFTGILSVNLAILNILPFPALDGGRLVFILYELVTKKRPRPSIEHWTNAFGMAILLSLMVLVTINDIRRIFETTRILNQLQRLWPF